MAKSIKRRKVATPCQMCDGPDTMEMVRCDECDGWHHFDCVGVGPEIADLDFVCPACKRRHASCKLPSTEIQKKRVQPSAKITETETTKRIKELTSMIEAQRQQLDGFGKVVFELKAVINSKDNEIASQSATLQKQQKQIDVIAIHLAELQTEMRSKNDQIVEQSTILDGQRKQINELFDQSTKNRKDDGKATEKFVDSQQNDSDLMERFLKLMCKSKTDLININDELCTPKMFYGILSKFCTFGGDVKYFITNMINRMISKELQGDMSYSGKRTTKKITLCEFGRIVDLIHFTCKEKFESYDSVAGEAILQKMLQNA